jgi:chemotaxis protein CheD
MPQVIEVGTADLAVAGSGYTITSGGIGSCVVVCLYDQPRKIGALCHIMLPEHTDGSDLNPLRFADTAIPLALEKMAEMGADPTQLTAELFGGASMFQNLGSFVNRIGEQNVAAVQRILGEHHIPISRMDVGGSMGRSVQFSLDTGTATPTTKV